jgi:hypothetical protein
VSRPVSTPSSPVVPHPPAAGVTLLLRLENLALAITAGLAFHAVGGNWVLFAILFLAPDLLMLGYLAGPSIGARLYNLAHTYVAVALLSALAWTTGFEWWLQIALIWCVHIGLDRALGFGLKYPSGFADTHLGQLRGPAQTRDVGSLAA